jgi:hypothetical protein
MSANELVTLWLEIDVALWFGGSIAWVIGLVHQWRLRRRFERKTGSDLYELRSLAQRYSAQPWMWLVEAPAVTWKMLAIGTTPLADVELEAMRRTFRRWINAGGLCIVAAVAWFLAPMTWLIVTHW